MKLCEFLNIKTVILDLILLNCTSRNFTLMGFFKFLNFFLFYSPNLIFFNKFIGPRKLFELSDSVAIQELSNKAMIWNFGSMNDFWVNFFACKTNARRAFRL